MSAHNVDQMKGGLTNSQKSAVVPLLGGIYVLLVIATLPLAADAWRINPQASAFMPMVAAGWALRETTVSVGWLRLAGTVAGVDAVAMAIAMAVGQVLVATGWNEPRWQVMAVGFGATFLIAWPATVSVVKIMTRRGDDTGDEGEGPA